MFQRGEATGYDAGLWGSHVLEKNGEKSGLMNFGKFEMERSLGNAGGKKAAYHICREQGEGQTKPKKGGKATIAANGA